MNPTEPLSRKLETLTVDDCVEALFRERDERKRPSAEWKHRCAGYPIHEKLDALLKEAFERDPRLTPTTAFLEGMRLGFGGFRDLAERQAANGDPVLAAALRRLTAEQFDAGLPDLRRLTITNLPAWRKQYPPFLTGAKISFFYHRLAQKQLVANLSGYDGIFAIAAWVVHALLQQSRAAATTA